MLLRDDPLPTHWNHFTPRDVKRIATFLDSETAGIVTDIHSDFCNLDIFLFQLLFISGDGLLTVFEMLTNLSWIFQNYHN